MESSSQERVNAERMMPKPKAAPLIVDAGLDS